MAQDDEEQGIGRVREPKGKKGSIRDRTQKRRRRKNIEYTAQTEMKESAVSREVRKEVSG